VLAATERRLREREREIEREGRERGGLGFQIT